MRPGMYGKKNGWVKGQVRSLQLLRGQLLLERATMLRQQEDLTAAAALIEKDMSAGAEAELERTAQ